MFTSLRSRLWLSYALVVSVSLAVVALVLLIFLIRNPVLSRQTQQKLRTVLNSLTARPQGFLDDSAALQRLADAQGVRILVFNTSRQLLIDTGANEASIPFPRRNILRGNSQTAIDVNGKAWLYSSSRT